MKKTVPSQLHLITAGILSTSISLSASAGVFSPLPTDISEPAGTYLPLSNSPLRADIKTIIGTGPCEIDNYSGCTLTDVNNDIDSTDKFKPEIKVHII